MSVPSVPVPSDFVTREGALEVLGVSDTTLKGLMRDGLLNRYQRPGTKRIFFARAELEEFLRPTRVER